ncbi:hypothetical protein CERZMDRAFT_91782 [Cercospora zeae-maydis SCOH1-5]|uniref:Uncharacterized protein n=1 Tax=Cercospora zeae-maydis SCOH1-5 TaxID=717836 RepID=A0A6A6EZ27_9PEZI|nr:hypothetical protein CERZMDRAFT_91782 [Cercospora zeae-maydis SCOH1-5]
MPRGQSAATCYTPRLSVKETSRTRTIVRDSTTRNTACALQRRTWIQNNYIPTRKGLLTLATIAARYKNSCPRDDDVEYEHFLTAAQAAYPSERITPGLKWMPKAKDGNSENGEKSRCNDAMNRHYAVSDWTSSMAEFCAAYLAPLARDGNAFAASNPGRTRQIHVDVLSWDI